MGNLLLQYPITDGLLPAVTRMRDGAENPVAAIDWTMEPLLRRWSRSPHHSAHLEDTVADGSHRTLADWIETAVETEERGSRIRVRSRLRVVSYLGSSESGTVGSGSVPAVDVDAERHRQPPCRPTRSEFEGRQPTWRAITAGRQTEVYRKATNRVRLQQSEYHRSADKQTNQRASDRVIITARSQQGEELMNS